MQMPASYGACFDRTNGHYPRMLDGQRRATTSPGLAHGMTLHSCPAANCMDSHDEVTGTDLTW